MVDPAGTETVSPSSMMETILTSLLSEALFGKLSGIDQFLN
jgi:hypothetical protein